MKIIQDIFENSKIKIRFKLRKIQKNHYFGDVTVYNNDKSTDLAYILTAETKFGLKSVGFFHGNFRIPKGSFEREM